MANLDPARAADRWAANTGASVGKYKDSIQNLNFNPMERAANDDGRYVLGCQNGDQKRKAKLLAIPLDRWKQITIAKAGRLGEGAMQAKGKYAAEAQKLFPYIAQGLSGLPRRGSKDMNKQRMSAWFDYMSQYRSTQFS